MGNRTNAQRSRCKFLCVVVAIQIVIVWCFLVVYFDCKLPSSHETRNATISVENTFYTSALGGTYYIQSGTVKYYFPNYGVFSEYSNNKLHKAIQIGDEIHITYYEDRWMLGFSKRNMVIDAYTDTEVYRTIEEYHESKDGLIPVTVILWVLIELMYSGVVWAYFSLNKAYFRKQKKRKTTRLSEKASKGKHT